ncbi:MAG TPA: Type 1 glutamine amidotransferase-like domain-containing protein [Xanthobacteraceae bacterium]|nr:Type 1 glutamine amidotransferase-like domain-containing protein [Xanthobacteraceae bacterium]
MRLFLVGATLSPPFEHCKDEMLKFITSSRRAGLITAANLFDEQSYFHTMEEHLTKVSPRISRELVHIRWNANWVDALNKVDSLIIPGGNTSTLLKRLHESGLLVALRERIRGGLPYIGSSAGANIAGPNILTANDWNVVGLTQFEALALVHFNINPHYVERSATDAPHSETRTLRIREFHQVWGNPVVAIEETAIVKVIGTQAFAAGTGMVKVFTKSGKQRWFKGGEHLTFDE